MRLVAKDLALEFKVHRRVKLKDLYKYYKRMHTFVSFSLITSISVRAGVAQSV